MAAELHVCSAQDYGRLSRAAPHQQAEFSHKVPQLQEQRHQPPGHDACCFTAASKSHALCFVANPNLQPSKDVDSEKYSDSLCELIQNKTNIASLSPLPSSFSFTALVTT